MATRIITAIGYVLICASGGVLAVFSVASESLRQKVSNEAGKPSVADIDCILFKATMLGFLITGESVGVGIAGFFATTLRIRKLENFLCCLSFLLMNAYVALVVIFVRHDPMVEGLHSQNWFLSTRPEASAIYQQCKVIVGWAVEPLVLVLLLICYLRIIQSVCCLLYLRNSSILPYYFSTDN